MFFKLALIETIAYFALTDAKAVRSTKTLCKDILEPNLVEKIASYQSAANDIIDFIVNADLKGETYKELAGFVDRYPRQPSGSRELEDSIDYMMERMRALNLEHVRGEQVQVPHWVRGHEAANLLQPIEKELSILGLGYSVGTSAEGITAPVLVVKSFGELFLKKDQVPGKIVVFNQGWINESYGATGQYRGYGASYASNYGAVASLIESATPFSLYTPHTGQQIYWENVTKIPTACITKEDADLLHRLQESGHDLKIHLTMFDVNLPLTTSRNVIGELTGKEARNEFVALSGHIDGWDVGQGAMDDAGGVVISMMALAALKKLNLRANRTIEAIGWTAEEMGVWGAQGFVAQHKLDGKVDNYSVAFEADLGVFKPTGLDFSGSEEAGCIVQEVLKLVSRINVTEFQGYPEPPVGSDISYLEFEGVPGISLRNENERYFWYHHSKADTMTLIKSDDLDLCTALWAVTSYVLADIPTKLPRVNESDILP